MLVPEELATEDSFSVVDFPTETIFQGQLLSENFQLEKTISDPDILKQFSPQEELKVGLEVAQAHGFTSEVEEAGLQTLQWQAAEAAWLGRWRTSCFSRAKKISFLSSDEEDIDRGHQLSPRFERVVDLWLSRNEDEAPSASQERALALISRKPAAIEKSAYKAIKTYLLEDFLEVDCDSSVRRAITLKAIPQLVELVAINVFRKTKDDLSLITFAFDCGWDEEHGCEVLFLGGSSRGGSFGRIQPR